MSRPVQHPLAASPPLSDTTVVSLEHSVAGPLCTRILADLGARVIKVERLPDGDFSRHWDDHVDGEGAQFWWLNRRKDGVALDLKTDVGKNVFERVLEPADVLVYNMSPTAADRLGLNSAEFVRRYPRLIRCQISGYGNATPYRDRKAYDMLIQAESGVMSLTGTPDQPMRTGVSLCDVGTGIYAAVLILAAVIEQRETGKGRHLDVSMFDATLEFLGPMLVSYLNAGVVFPRIPDKHHAIAPYGVFRCRDGRRLVIAIQQDAEWRRFCVGLLEEPALADDVRFSSNPSRIANRAQVDLTVAAAFERFSSDRATALLDELDLAYAVVNDLEDVANHAVSSSLGITRDVETSAGKTITALVGLAERAFSPNQAARARPPELGEDTSRIVASLALLRNGDPGRASGVDLSSGSSPSSMEEERKT